MIFLFGFLITLYVSYVSRNIIFPVLFATDMDFYPTSDRKTLKVYATTCLHPPPIMLDIYVN